MQRRSGVIHRKWYTSGWFVFLVGVLGVVLFFGVINMALRYRFVWERYRHIRSEYIATDIEQKQLKSEISELNTTDGLEYYAREQFRAIKPGEQLVVVVKPQMETDVTHADLSRQKKPWYNLSVFTKEN